MNTVDDAEIQGRAAAKMALAGLEPAAFHMDKLKEIAGVYGKVNSVSRFEAGHKETIYLVSFERREDAALASADLGCELFGFSSLMVTISHEP